VPIHFSARRIQFDETVLVNPPNVNSSRSTSRMRQGTALAAIAVVLLVAAFLRLDDLGVRSLSHAESYTPGIDLPWELSNPHPRHSVWQTLAGTLAGEPHPPGYYMLLLGWTEIFGSSIIALRAPSALFGIGAVLLVYLVARRTEDPLTAVLSAAMLAVHGLHIYWSQTSRMYAMACFIGLMTTLLLLLATESRERTRQRTLYALYAGLTVLGLSAHVYYWALFTTQALWVLSRSITRTSEPPAFLRLQLLTCLLASPLLAAAAFQSERATRPTTVSALEAAAQYLRFGSLFESDVLAWPDSAGAIALIAALPCALALIAFSLLRSRDGVEPQAFDPDGPLVPVWLGFASTALICVAVVAFTQVARHFDPSRGISLVIATLVVPLALPFAGLGLTRYWLQLQGIARGLTSKHAVPEALLTLPVFLAFLPLLILAGISVITPILLVRGTLIFAPYLIIVVCGGLAELVRRDRRWVLLALVLLAAHSVSAMHFRAKPAQRDYKQIAAQWAPRIEETDLIFIHHRTHEISWMVSPIFYYLHADEYNFVAENYAAELATGPSRRVWVVFYPHGGEVTDEMNTALAGHRMTDRLDAAAITAALYVPGDDG
jgi:4-amino-4-deoxy-L-arabinose transferase-like glycosyltransferase